MPSKVSAKKDDNSIENNDQFSNSDVDQIASLETQDSENSFEEIPPLLSGFNFEIEKQKIDVKLLSDESLPEIVYMLVDKKVELEFQPISAIPEWNFLPDTELTRNAIVLFSNQRNAKRSCTKNQRVIKIPNTLVFKISKSYLITKGITRLIFEDSIIGLDN